MTRLRKSGGGIHCLIKIHINGRVLVKITILSGPRGMKVLVNGTATVLWMNTQGTKTVIKYSGLHQNILWIYYKLKANPFTWWTSFLFDAQICRTNLDLFFRFGSREICLQLSTVMHTRWRSSTNRVDHSESNIHTADEFGRVNDY